MLQFNFNGKDDLNGIEEKKGSSQLHNIKPDGKKDHPNQRQSGGGSDSPSASSDVCEVSSSPINTVILGDCLEKLKTLPDDSVDLIVTDPPYGIDFIGKDWDKVVPGVEIWKDCLRVLKPGAFAFIMSSPRQDVLCRNYINIEKACFETGFTSLYWTYASGFPKPHNISKTLDKKFGAKREIIARNPNSRENCDKSNTIYESGTVGKTAYITEPATQDARRLDGSYAGFQPKPAVEAIIVVMKPKDEKSYTDQALSNRKGITWLDDCQIPCKDEQVASKGLSKKKSYNGDQGRVPANLLVSDDVLGDTSRYFSLDAWAERNLPFLIVPKASKKEKNAGCENLKVKPSASSEFRPNHMEKALNGETGNPYGRWKKVKNNHPTVKPVELMTYLITMGSREGDVVLDPFCGSGTTCMAAKMLKRRYIGIELSPEYHEIAMKRIESVEPINDERKIDKDISGPIIQNLKLIVDQQMNENPIGVKIALKFYVNKVSEIKRSHSVVDIFEDNEKTLRNDLTDFFRKEARRFVEPNKNGGKGSKTKIEIRIKNTPEVAGLCLVIKNMVRESSPEAGNNDNLRTSDRSEFEVEDLMPYLPTQLEYA